MEKFDEAAKASTGRSTKNVQNSKSVEWQTPGNDEQRKIKSLYQSAICKYIQIKILVPTGKKNQPPKILHYILEPLSENNVEWRRFFVLLRGSDWDR